MPPSFFFQAEDGIRDTSVTGVQTCALPIWRPDSGRGAAPARRAARRGVVRRLLHHRSEERRVGKEARPRGAPQARPREEALLRPARPERVATPRLPRDPPRDGGAPPEVALG